MKQQQRRSWLLELTAKVLKYFLLSLAGCTLAYVVAFVLGWWPITDFIVPALTVATVGAGADWMSGGNNGYC